MEFVFFCFVLDKSLLDLSGVGVGKDVFELMFPSWIRLAHASVFASHDELGPVRLQ
jgi:hypothetical protein